MLAINSKRIDKHILSTYLPTWLVTRVDHSFAINNRPQNETSYKFRQISGTRIPYPLRG